MTAAYIRCREALLSLEHDHARCRLIRILLVDFAISLRELETDVLSRRRDP